MVRIHSSNGLKVLAILVTSVVMFACKSNDDLRVRVLDDEGVDPATRVEGPRTQAQLNTVGFLNRRLNQRVAVERTGARRTPTNTLEVWSVFRNRTNALQEIQVRTQYFGPGREPNEGPDAWQTMFLSANAIETYRTYSTRTDPEYYYIEVREAP